MTDQMTGVLPHAVLEEQKVHFTPLNWFLLLYGNMNGTEAVSRTWCFLWRLEKNRLDQKGKNPPVSTDIC